LRFQIEFTFRDAKQHFGLEDFMGVTKTCVSNAMGLSLFLVNLSTYLLGDLGREGVDAGIADLRSWYRGRFYASAVLKLLPEPPIPSPNRRRGECPKSRACGVQLK
jgi:putative transposase